MGSIPYGIVTLSTLLGAIVGMKIGLTMGRFVRGLELWAYCNAIFIAAKGQCQFPQGQLSPDESAHQMAMLVTNRIMDHIKSDRTVAKKEVAQS